jgi:Bacterial Ig domain
VVGLAGTSTAAFSLSSADQTAPTLTLSAPSSGSTVSGSTTVSADAGDDTALASVQFKLDGANLGAPETAAPYQAAWDTTAVANGSHVLSVVASDAAGNSATVTAAVTVSNAAAAAPPPSTAIAVAKVFEGSDTDRQTHNFALTAAVPAGQTLILTHVSTVDATDGTGGIVTPSGVSDSAGDTWHQDGVSHNGHSFQTVEIWSARTASALPAGATVTVKGYPRGLSDEIAIFAVSGIAGPDQVASSDGTYSTSQATPSVTTSQAHELLVGVHGQSSSSAPWWTPETASPAWTERVDRFDGGNIARGIAVETREVNAVGSYRAAGSIRSATTGNNLLVTYKAAG